MSITAIKGLAYATESTFGVDPAASYIRVPFATDIEWSPNQEVVSNPLLLDGIRNTAIIQGSEANSTLSFRVPLYTLGAGSTTAEVTDIMTLIGSCIGTVSSVNNNTRAYNAAASGPLKTPEFAGAVSESPVLMSLNTSDLTTPAYQQRVIHNETAGGGGGKIYDMLGQMLDDDGNAITLGDDGNFGLYRNVWKKNTAKFDNSLSFELFGDDDDDAWILTGCNGTVSIEAPANDIAWATFSWRVATFTRTTKSSLTYLTATSGVIPVLEPPNGLPHPATYGHCSIHTYNSSGSHVASTKVDAIGFSLDFGIDVTRVSSTNSSQGISRWIRTAHECSGTLTTYYDTDIMDLFTSPAYQTYLYYQIGRQYRHGITLYVANVIAQQYPGRDDSGGHLVHNLSFKAGRNKIAQTGNGDQNDADVIIGFS